MDDMFQIGINSLKESDNTIQEATVFGFKNAAVVGVVAVGPIMTSTVAFFITADKTILENAKQNSRAKFDKSASKTS